MRTPANSGNDLVKSLLGMFEMRTHLPEEEPDPVF